MMNSIGLFEMLRHRVSKKDPYGLRPAMSYLFAVFFGSEIQGMQRFSSISQVLEDTQAFENIVFTHCPSEALMAKFNAQDGSVVLFTDFDEGRFDLAAGFSEAALLLFLKTYSRPLVTRLTEATAPSICAQTLPCLYVFTNPSVPLQAPENEGLSRLDCSSLSAASSLEDAQLARSFLEKTLQVIGKRFRGVLQVVLVDGVEENPAGERLAQDLGVSAFTAPLACVVEVEAPFRQYRSLEGCSPVKLMAFVQSWEAGWLPPFSP